MDLNQLRSFREIARTQSFTRAAERVFLTQPAVSQQMRALEDEIGTQLLERGRGGVRLTEAGQAFHATVGTVLDLLDEVQGQISGPLGKLSGRVVIGTSDTNCMYVLPPVLAAFTQAHPTVELAIRNRMSPETVRMVLDREVDFGLVTLPVRQAGVCCTELFSHRDVAIFPAAHALARRRRVRLDELAALPLLVLEPGSTSRALLDAAFRQAALEPRIAMELGGVEVIKRLVESGMGVAVVPEVTVEAERRAGRLWVAAVQGLRDRPLGLVELRGRVRTRAVEALVAMLRAQTATPAL